jgi:hypothetical protein
MNVLRTALLVTIVCSFGVELSLAQQPNDLAGLYRCQGDTPSGEKYEGIVEIVEHGDRFLVRWLIPPHDAYIGVGVVQGDFLAVSYGGRVLGLVIYEIKPDMHLVGRWTAVNAGRQLFSETLTKMNAADLEMPQPEPIPEAAPAPPPTREEPSLPYGLGEFAL